MNAYISNDGIPSQKPSILLKKSSYRLFLYSLSLCFTAVSFFHTKTVHAAKSREEVPKTLKISPSALPAPKNVSADLQALQLQKAEQLTKSFNGNLNHCDPKNIQTVAVFKDLQSLEEVFLDKFTGLSSYQVFQIEDDSQIEKGKLYTSVLNGWVVEAKYLDPKTIDFIHFQGPAKKDRSAPISCYYHMVGEEIVIESEILSPNVGPANMVVRANNKYLTMYKNQSVTVDNLVQTIYSSYRKTEGKPDQLFRQEIWSTSKNSAEVMNSAKVFFMNNQPEGRPSFLQIRAFDHNQRARATGPNEVVVELVNQNKLPLTFLSNGKIIRLPDSGLLEKIQSFQPSQLLKTNSKNDTATPSFVFGSCLLEIDQKTQAFMLVKNTQMNFEGEPAPVKVGAHVLLSLPDALTQAKCY